MATREERAEQMYQRLRHGDLEIRLDKPRQFEVQSQRHRNLFYHVKTNPRNTRAIDCDGPDRTFRFPVRCKHMLLMDKFLRLPLVHERRRTSQHHRHRQ